MFASTFGCVCVCVSPFGCVCVVYRCLKIEAHTVAAKQMFIHIDRQMGGMRYKDQYHDGWMLGSCLFDILYLLMVYEIQWCSFFKV